MMRHIGKLPMDVLKRTVFRWTGRTRRDVILGPALGEDAAVLSVRGVGRIVVACDPVTGSENRVGWLSVHVNANDVAVCGAMPAWFSSCILIPSGGESIFEAIVKQIHRAAMELGASVITGHSEVTDVIDRPIVVGTMIGKLVHGRYYSTKDARPGDKILMTKTAAIEGTAILATDLADILRPKVEKSLLDRAARLYKSISVVKDAMKVASSGVASAMHDPTEGGVIGGLYELAEASGTGFLVDERRILVAEETRKVCEAIGCDPLRLISSGALLATVRGKYESLLRSLRRAGIKTAIIGEVTKRRGGRKLLRRDGTEEDIKEFVLDELWRILAEHGKVERSAYS